MKKKIKKINSTIVGFGGKFKVIEGEINSVNGKIFFIDESLKKSLYPKN